MSMLSGQCGRKGTLGLVGRGRVGGPAGGQTVLSFPWALGGARCETHFTVASLLYTDQLCSDNQAEAESR